MYELESVAVPFGLLTVTATVPAARAGAETTREVADRETIVALVPPKVTDEALPRFVPESVTCTPAVNLPLVGATEFNVGTSI